MTTLQPPGPLPPIDNTTRADRDHYTPGRTMPIDRLLLHATATRNRTGNAPSRGWLTTQSPPPDKNVSAHHLYGRDGTRYDLVYRTDTAYHAGRCNLPAMNERSIGHEIETTNGSGLALVPYTDAQLNAVAYTVACEMLVYGIPWVHVALHKDVALPPGRKTDPMGLDMADLAYRVQGWTTFLRSVPPEDAHKWFI